MHCRVDILSVWCFYLLKNKLLLICMLTFSPLGWGGGELQYQDGVLIIPFRGEKAGFFKGVILKRSRAGAFVGKI